MQLGLGLSRLDQASAAKAIGLIERDRYRISAPSSRPRCCPACRLFASRVFGAWKSADYDLMLQLMELSKARASIRRLLSPRTGESPARPAAAELNDEIHGLDPVMGEPDSAEDQQRAKRRGAAAAATAAPATVGSPRHFQGDPAARSR